MERYDRNFSIRLSDDYPTTIEQRFALHELVARRLGIAPECIAPVNDEMSFDLYFYWEGDEDISTTAEMATKFALFNQLADEIEEIDEFDHAAVHLFTLYRWLNTKPNVRYTTSDILKEIQDLPIFTFDLKIHPTTGPAEAISETVNEMQGFMMERFNNCFFPIYFEEHLASFVTEADLKAIEGYLFGQFVTVKMNSSFDPILNEEVTAEERERLKVAVAVVDRLSANTDLKKAVAASNKSRK